MVFTGSLIAMFHSATPSLAMGVLVIRSIGPAVIMQSIVRLCANVQSANPAH